MLSLFFFFNRDYYNLLYRVIDKEDKIMSKMEKAKKVLKNIVIVALILGLLGACLIFGGVGALLAWLF